MPNQNEVGAAWKKQAASGLTYLSVSLNLDKLMEATGGLTNGKVNLALFAKKNKSKDSQPDYDLVYSPRQGAKQAETRDEPDLDDPLPF